MSKEIKIKTETTNNGTKATRDVFAVYQNNVDKVLNAVKQSVPKYHQSIANAQQEYVNACENAISSAITLQREFVKSAGYTTPVPEAALKTIRDTTEEIVKMSSIGNQIALTTIDATQQNIKTFNDNAKAFADLNRNIVQSWISAFAVPKN